jgi:hypothetical protein
MKQQELAKPIRNRRRALVIGSLAAATMVLLGPDHILTGGKLAMAKTAAADEAGRSKRDSSVPPARDSSIAAAEEYQMARQQGTRQALELFIARHPDSPLAEQARADLRQIPR